MSALRILSTLIVHAFGFSLRGPRLSLDALGNGSAAHVLDQKLDQPWRDALLALRASKTTELASQNKSWAAQTVWLVGLPRSGTSLVQKIVAHAAVGQIASVFAMFEPCHPLDTFKGAVIGSDGTASSQCLRRALACDFHDLQIHSNQCNVDLLAGTAAPAWPSVYSGPQISKLCSQSMVRVFKTIHPAPTGIKEISESVGDFPMNVQLIQILRDPRAIYSSLFENRDKFPGEAQASFTSTICGKLVEWSKDAERFGGHLGSLSMLQVGYEKLLKNPIDSIVAILNYLQWPSSHELENFLDGHMYAKSCDENAAYGECRTPDQTNFVLTKWRQILSSQQLQEFDSESCKKAVSLFGYTPP